MNRPRALAVTAVVALLFTVLPPSVLRGQEIGRIAYLEGDVQLLRDGEILDAYDIRDGEPLLQLDVIQTGFDGYVEVELDRPSPSIVRVRENSAYYVELSGDGARTDVRLRVLAGRLQMDVSSLTAGSTLSVETQTAVLGVRGTTFDVLTAPDETTLFGVREGRVAIASAGGQISAAAGQAVEAPGSGRPSREPVSDGDFDAYYARWTEIRLQAFRSGAPTFVRAYVRRYLDTRDTFDRAYRDLVAFRPRLEEALAAEAGSLGTDMRFRAEMSPAIIRMRSILPLFETTVYRLRELQRFHSQGIGRTQIGERDSTTFFRAFSMDERELLRRLAEVRTIFRMYGELEDRSFGGLPDGTGDSPFESGGSLLDSMRF